MAPRISSSLDTYGLHFLKSRKAQVREPVLLLPMSGDQWVLQVGAGLSGDPRGQGRAQGLPRAGACSLPTELPGGWSSREAET